MWRVKLIFYLSLPLILLPTYLFSETTSNPPTATKVEINKPKQEKIIQSTNPKEETPKPKPEEEFEELLKKELEGGVTTAELSQEQEISWGWQITKTFLVLFFLIGIFWLGWQLYRFKRKLPTHESGVMQTLYRYTISTGREIHIVKLSKNLLVLGISDSGIHLITEIGDQNKINEIILDCAKESSEEQSDFLWELTKSIKEKFSDWSSPQKNILENTSTKNQQEWSELRKSSKVKIQNLKEQKKFFSKE